MEITLAGKVNDLSLLALPEVYFCVRTLWSMTHLSGFFTFLALFKFLFTWSASFWLNCSFPRVDSVSSASISGGMHGMRGCRLSRLKAMRSGEREPGLLGIFWRTDRRKKGSS